MGTKQYDSATDLLTFSRASGGTALSKISYGNELVTNGTFDSDLSGWVASHGASTQEFDNGTIKVQHTGYNGYSRQYLTGLVVGTSYQVNFSVTNDTQGGGGGSFVGIWETNCDRLGHSEVYLHKGGCWVIHIYFYSDINSLSNSSLLRAVVLALQTSTTSPLKKSSSTKLMAHYKCTTIQTTYLALSTMLLVQSKVY